MDAELKQVAIRKNLLILVVIYKYCPADKAQKQVMALVEIKIWAECRRKLFYSACPTDAFAEFRTTYQIK